MTVERVSGAEKFTRDLLPSRQNNSSTDFAEILSERAELQNAILKMPLKLSDNLQVSHAIVEKRPSCIKCGMTISDEGTCLCEYPTVIANSGINLKHNSAAADSSAQPEAPVSDKTQNISYDNLPSSDEDIKLRHKCPICGTVSDDGSCACDTLKSDPRLFSLINSKRLPYKLLIQII